MTRDFFRKASDMISNNDFDRIAEAAEFPANILIIIESARKKQVKRIKSGEVGTRNSMLYFNLLSECKNLILHSHNLLKAQRDFADCVTNGVKTD